MSINQFGKIIVTSPINSMRFQKLVTMIKIIKPLIILVIIACLNTPSSNAQEALKPRPSPLEMVTMKYEDVYIKITYGRPHKRGREIFGELLPFGEVWRTGANECGAYNYNEKMDVVRFDVPVSTTSDVYEPFTIEFEQKAQSAELVMMWDQTKVAIPIEFM